MSNSVKTTKGELLGEVWRMMFAFLIKTGESRSDSLARRNLTPNDSRALMSLDEGEGAPIGVLAKTWQCDPSTATWLVDRLEKNGLVERVQSSVDRRVKRVRLTKAGTKARADILLEFHEPPAQLSKLTSEELRALKGLLTKL